MSIPYTKGTAFTTPTCVGGWVEYPFANEGDGVTKIYHHNMMVKESSYSPLSFDDVMTAADEKPERSPFSDDSSAYWVGDSTPNPADGGNVMFDRKFANIPAQRTNGAGYYSVELPGSSVTVTDNLATSTADEALSSSGSTLIVTFTVASADVGNFNVGQRVSINNDADASGKFQATVRNYPGVYPQYYTNYFFIDSARVVDITGNTITTYFDGTTVRFVSDFSSPTLPLTTFTISNVLNTRNPSVENMPSIIIQDYFKVDDLRSIQVIDKFYVKYSSSNNTPVDTLSNSTSPTASEYLTSIVSSEYLPAEISTVTRWMGNIWVRETTKFLAK